MAFDDIAYAKENPFPGTLYNGKDGVNYYDGCVIDYRQEDVSKENFLAVMTGK
jgi:glycosylphosphatidylinositol transamidase (GPIT) subunit GPI8